MKINKTGYFVISAIILFVTGVIYALNSHSPKDNAVISGKNLQQAFSQAGQQSNQNTTTSKENTDMEQKIMTMLNDAYAHPPDNVYSAVGKTFPAHMVSAVTVTNQPSGGYDVHVDINSPVAPNVNYFGDEYIVYVALYKNNTLGISNISVSDYRTVQDQYGYTKTVPYVTTSLDSSIASKLNWNVSAVDTLLSQQLRCTGYYTSNCGDGMLPAVE